MLLCSSIIADEVPLPGNITTYENPVLDGVSFMAIDSTEYHLEEQMPGTLSTRDLAVNRAMNVCRFLGFKNVATYSLAFVVEDGLIVLTVDKDLVASPNQSIIFKMEEEGKEYRSSIFAKISCRN
jgi:hypothetical protein